ncbi:hypothetical protein N0V83_001634 [Neocucurbitaria cava]|uniref:Chaperone DnaJ C-terminal domain-containing protein n=1 Tax=Neocucurbitaria cava TaxID=798079 RepID=A0A9W8YI96_9PLEO|nr:hypothetical protein N0V83_001634 [Neocucurbitaria cava]
MAGFGFSLGDIALVTNYAYTVYKSCKNAGDAFKSIRLDVASLRSLLLVLNDECTNPHSSVHQLRASRRVELESHLQGCKADLREVRKMLHRYRSLKTTGARRRDRLSFTPGRQAELREKINAHSARLQQFISGMSVGFSTRVESKIDTLLSLLQSPQPGPKIHLLSGQDVQMKLEAIHRDILAGRRHVFAINDADAAVDIEDEVLGDDMTEIDVDLTQEVSAFMERVRPDASYQTRDHTTRPRGEYPQDSLRKFSPRNGRTYDPASHNPGTPSASIAYEVRLMAWTLETRNQAIVQASKAIPARHEPTQTPLAVQHSPQCTCIPEKARTVLDLPREVSSTSTGNRLQPKEDAKTIIDLRSLEPVKGNNASETYHWQPSSKSWSSHEKSFLTAFAECSGNEPTCDVAEHVVELQISLEEVFTGTVRGVKLRRNLLAFGAGEQFVSGKASCSVLVKKGVADGHMIRYVGLGNQHEDSTEDVVFILKYSEAQNGWKRELAHLDGRVLEMWAEGATNPDHRLMLEGCGLPRSYFLTVRGSLWIYVSVNDAKGTDAQKVEDEEKNLAQTGEPFCARWRGSTNIFMSLPKHYNLHGKRRRSSQIYG